MSITGNRFESEYDPEKRKHMRAINGKVLRVDLSCGKIWMDEPGEEFYRRYFGGRGVVLHYLLNEMPANADPLGAENLLVFAPGILTGTILPGAGRHGTGAKSPLTGALASCESGGWWGAELKKAGFDALVIQGKAEQPVYLSIRDGEAEICDATHLWGKNTADAQDQIRTELKDERTRVAGIGPAGENLVRFACIINDANRAAGRSGLGAVMGSKNLKAVAVRGTAGLGLADREIMRRTVGWITKTYKESMGWAIATGTSGSVLPNMMVGATPVRNYLDSYLEGIEQLDASTFHEKILKDRDNCDRCAVSCKLVVEYQSAEANRKIDPRYGGPEYETLGGLGALCAVTDILAVAKANELCAAFGIDTISMGGTAAFAMECFEKGLLPADEDGFVARFGDGDSLVELIQRIAFRSGIGDRLAEGSERVANQLGGQAREMAVTVKGQELPLHEPRLKNAMGLGYAFSATGADHMANMDDMFATHDFMDVCARLQELGFEIPLPLYGLDDNKLKAYVTEVAYKNFLDSAVICHFYPYIYEHMVDAINGATGWNIDRDYILETGKRIVTMGRLFLIREGFSAEDDRLPARTLQPHVHADGPLAGKAMSEAELKDGLTRFYREMGWNARGIPELETLKDLEIELG